MSDTSISLYFFALALAYPVYIAFIGHAPDLTNVTIEIGFVAIAVFYHFKSRQV